MRRSWIAWAVAGCVAAAVLVVWGTQRARRPKPERETDAGQIARLDAQLPPEAGDSAADDRRVEHALALADAQVRSEIEVLDAARLLNKALLARPERARVLARSLGRLRNRKLAFRVALLVGRYLTDPAVHDAVLAQLRAGGNHAREAAAYAVYGWRGEAAVARALAHNLADETAPEPVRSAAAWALSNCLYDLPADERAVVRAQARALVGDARRPAALRAEAAALLEPVGADRALLWRVLERDEQREVALAAARVLLTRGGAKRERVFEALARFARSDGDDMAARALAALLAEGRGGPVAADGVSATADLTPRPVRPADR